MSKAKVLEIGSGNFDGKGGLSIIAWNWYQKMDFNKLQIDFLSCVLPSNEYTAYIKEHGGNFYQVRGINSVARQFQKISLVKRVARENQYDCIHIHASYPIEAFIYYIAAKEICKKIIIHSHSSEMDRNSFNSILMLHIKNFLNKVVRSFLGNKNIIRLACSDLAAEWMFPKMATRNRNYAIIKNGIDISAFKFNQEVRTRIRRALNLENKFVIGHVGRFTYAKNHFFLLDIFHCICKKQSDCILLLVGGGDLEKEIKTKAKNLGLDDAITFYGTTSNIGDIYQAMDCFVLPSHFEGLGMVAIEAQAASLRTLCANTIPNEAQITDFVEYMSLSDPPEKWAEKILSYKNGYERKDMFAEIKAAGYDIADSAKQLEDLYIECTKKTSNYYA